MECHGENTLYIGVVRVLNRCQCVKGYDVYWRGALPFSNEKGNVM
jgi:hypothetical protein